MPTARGASADMFVLIGTEAAIDIESFNLKVE
jgi:hypothetical protein